MRLIGLFAALAVSVSAWGMSASAQSEFFNWPAVDEYAIPDARLSSVIGQARSEEEDARQRAREAQIVAGQARRLVGLRSAIGRGPLPVTIGDGVTASAVAYGDQGGAQLGTVSWNSGASLTGHLDSATGEYTPSPESSLSAFRGWVWGLENATPTPMTGRYEFDNGDTFLGSYNTGSNASGVYRSADGERVFVGTINFELGGFYPVQGYMEDRTEKKVLAVVR